MQVTEELQPLNNIKQGLNKAEISCANKRC
jgi:hypothetical protein